MAPHGFLVARDSSSNGINHVAIAGFSVVGVVLLAGFVWFAVRFYRKRSQVNSERDSGAAVPNVRGPVKEGGPNEKTTEPLPGDVQAIRGHMFSRAQMGAVVMPDKALARSNVTKEELVDYHAQAGNLPRPFTPFSFALAAGGSTAQSGRNSSRLSAGSFITATGNSSQSVGSSGNRLSVVSTVSSLGQTTRRKVRQLFDPVLPDELVLSLGEHVTLIQSFDDGWCVVGRPSLMKADDIELGAVPAWCFVKPTKGPRAERPMRIASLGVTVQLDQPGHTTRESVISWSNF